MPKAILYLMCAFFGAVLLVAGAQSNWFMAALMGAGLGITVALVAHAYPRDAAPPADRRHEANMRRRKAALDEFKAYKASKTSARN